VDFEECHLVTLDKRLNEHIAAIQQLALDGAYRHSFDVSISRLDHISLRFSPVRQPEPVRFCPIPSASTAQLVRNSRYQQLAEGIERTDRRELERRQMGFAEWQLLQHGVRCLSVGHIQDEDDTRPVFQRIPLVDLAIEIELRTSVGKMR
jgi:hypothetical protein